MTDAEAREKLVVLANSRSELDLSNKTPSKPPPSTKYQHGLPTPMTERKPRDEQPTLKKFQTQTPSKIASAKAQMMAEDTPGFDSGSESYDWDDDLDDEVEKVMQKEKPRQPDFGRDVDSPRKVPRTPGRSSPGKRKLSEFEYKPPGDAAITPQLSFQSKTESIPPSAEVSMTPTPSRYTNALSGDSQEEFSEFAGSALKLLESHRVVLPRKAQNDLLSLLNSHDLKTKGIIRGRDISRLAIKKKDEQIMRLNERIQSLESQMELDRAVVNGLRNHNS